MMLLGYCARYEGEYGDLPVVQAGRFKIIAIRPYQSVPYGLGVLLVRAQNEGAQFLIIDPKASDNEKTEWIDIREAA